MDIYHSDRQPNCDGWSEDGAETHHGQCQATKGKRTYDCNFCKRGFTNAQALGGHMNIHRRDRAKAAKQQLHHHQLVSDEYGYGSPGFAVGDLAGSCTYPALDVHQASRSQYLCFQQRHVGGYSAPRRSTVVPGCLSSDHGDLWGANLSLGIGSGGRKEDRELDLELRLGHVEP